MLSFIEVHKNYYNFMVYIIFKYEFKYVMLKIRLLLKCIIDSETIYYHRISQLQETKGTFKYNLYIRIIVDSSHVYRFQCIPGAIF